MTKPAFLGGALSFKGDKKKKAKKKSRKSKHRIDDKEHEERIPVQSLPDDDDDDEMTEAERKALKYKLEKDRKDLDAVASKSHRERIEEFNEKLGQLTEHNDIPRVSREERLVTWRFSCCDRVLLTFCLFPLLSLTGQCGWKWIKCVPFIACRIPWENIIESCCPRVMSKPRGC